MRPFLFLTLLLPLLVSCELTSVRDVVKHVAEQQVDTTHYEVSTLRLSPFSAVEINCFADVTYHQIPVSETPSVRLQAPADLLKQMVVKVDEDGVMRLNINARYRVQQKVVPVIHIYGSAVSDFAINGGKCLRLGELTLHSPVRVALNGVGAIFSRKLSAPDVDVVLDGAGTIYLEGIDTHRLKAELNGAGNITLSGRARTSKVRIEGAGNIDTTELKK